MALAAVLDAVRAALALGRFLRAWCVRLSSRWMSSSSSLSSRRFTVHSTHRHQAASLRAPQGCQGSNRVPPSCCGARLHCRLHGAHEHQGWPLQQVSCIGSHGVSCMGAAMMVCCNMGDWQVQWRDLHHVNAMCCSCLSNQLHADSPRVLASVKSLLMSDSAEL